jgi:hypothetical protein
MNIVNQYGANYLVCNPLEYNPNKETLFFGETEIIPGTKIKKIGEKKRTSFEASEDSFFKYEGTLIIREVKHCVFASTWKDNPGEFIYRFIFAMDDTNKPNFLFLSNKTKQSGADIDCTKVTLIQ